MPDCWFNDMEIMYWQLLFGLHDLTVYLHGVWRCGM